MKTDKVNSAADTLRRRLNRQGPRHRSVAPPWRGYALHAMTFSAGYDSPAWPAYDFHGLKRGQTEWGLFQYTFAGQGMLCYENQTMTLNPGQAMLLTLPHDHRYWVAPNTKWSFFYLCMQGSEILRAWEHIIQNVGPVLTLSPQADALTQAADICSDLLTHEHDSPWALSARTYELAMALVAMNQRTGTSQRDVTHEVSAEGEPVKRSRPRYIQKAIDLARQPHKSGPPLDVAAMANAAGLSRHHFSRLFSSSEGMGPGEYLARVRLRLAVKLLQTTELPIKQIAYDCGYADANYFAKAFRKAYTLSPRDFRARGLGRAASE